MYHLVYVSTAVELMDATQLRQILSEARTGNLALGVTGALLYRDGTFMQVLEGHELVVQELYAKIRDDQRHYDVTFLIDGESEGRQFDSWTMAFRDLTADESELAEGFRQFTLDDSRDALPNRAERLLRSFRRSLVLP